MIDRDYGEDGNSTIPYVSNSCASANETCFEHIKEELIEYLTNMLINDIEEEKE